jgi:hypothetical protein
MNDELRTTLLSALTEVAPEAIDIPERAYGSLATIDDCVAFLVSHPAAQP